MGKFTYVLLMLIIAILFSVFSYSIGTAIKENPQYDDYCTYQYREAKPLTVDEDTCPFIEPISCSPNDQVRTTYDDNGCVESYECDTCGTAYQDAQSIFKQIIFYTMIILGLAAIITALFITPKGETVEWIANGFLFGGLINLFVGTIFYFSEAPSYLRPIIMIVELGIVIYVAIRKLRK